MMKKLMAIVLLAVSPLFAIEGLYFGAQAGQVQLRGETQTFHDNAIGFGIDIGIRTQSYLDVMFQSQLSTHDGYTSASKTTKSNSLKIYSQTLAANVHFGNTDFDFTLGGGPGAYIMSAQQTNTYFGLHLDGGSDIIISDQFRVGLQGRYHFLFKQELRDDYWSIMARIGYQLDIS